MEFLSHFGLERLPFAREATSFDYYQAARHDRVLMQIQGKLAQGETRITITGAGGMGKSMLAFRLTEVLSPELFAVCLLRESIVALPGHVEAVLTAVYGSTDADQIAARKARGIQPVVLIDGAEYLHAQSEAMLDEFAMAGVALVRFAHGGAGDIALDSWDEGTLARMLLHRIRAAGAHRPLFDKDSLLAIVRRAAGNPGVATALSQEGLLCAWYAGLESVNKSITDALCQGDLDAEALNTVVSAAQTGGSVSVPPVVQGSAELELSADTVAVEEPEPDVDGTLDVPPEQEELDALLGATGLEPNPEPQDPSRDFLDQSQFISSEELAAQSEPADFGADDVQVDLGAELTADNPAAPEAAEESFDLGADGLSDDLTSLGNGSEDLSVDVDVLLDQPQAGGEPLPGSTDDFDLTQLDALVASDGLTTSDAPDEEAFSDKALDDELAAFEALASAPASSPVPAAPAAPAAAPAADDDLDDMFASLENDAPAPAAASAKPVASAPQAVPPASSDNPLDDIDAMLGSWDDAPAPAASAKPAAAAAKAPQAKAANIEDELDDLLAKFDS